MFSGIVMHLCIHVQLDVNLSTPMKWYVHVHHLSVYDGWFLAAVRRSRVCVVGLGCNGLNGNKLQGARGGVIWIWRTERSSLTKRLQIPLIFTLSVKGGTNCHTPLLSLRLFSHSLSRHLVSLRLTLWDYVIHPTPVSANEVVDGDDGSQR